MLTIWNYICVKFWFGLISDTVSAIKSERMNYLLFCLAPKFAIWCVLALADGYFVVLSPWWILWAPCLRVLITLFSCWHRGEMGANNWFSGVIPLKECKRMLGSLWEVSQLKFSGWVWLFWHPTIIMKITKWETSFWETDMPNSYTTCPKG